MNSGKKTMLIIMDGWGISPNPEVSAIDKASTPYIDSLRKNNPHSQLRTDGEFVGLPNGQMGNSEVGHMNIGAGRIVYQELLRINNAVADGTLAANETLLSALQTAHRQGVRVHLMGLVSDGGVHSHIEHLKALCAICDANELNNVFVHAFTDGRDCDPKSGKPFISDLEDHLTGSRVQLASVIGRYYAMDRDNRWERIKLAYDMLTSGIGESSTNLPQSIEQSYQKDITDEFLKPIVKVDENGKAVTTVEENDLVICFNFRTDRCRQITMALTQTDFAEHGMHTMSLQYLTMTRYDENFRGVDVIFEKDQLSNTLGEWLSIHGKKQIRIAETEKYAHVTFFFNGGREQPFEGEKRLLIASPKVATYDLKPEMSAFEVRDAILPELEAESADYICLNFANADMVGHTGIFAAAEKAVETVDACVRAVAEMARKHGYSVLITADHGNSDNMINADGSPNTAHSTNPVPLFLIDPENRYNQLKNGKLADLAPTLLKLMDMPIPEQMTGECLI